MVSFFSPEQMSQPGGYGRFARGMTYVAVAVFFTVALVMGLLAIAWVITGPVEKASYSHAPRCAAAFTDSCRGYVSGQITSASISDGRTEFGVTAAAHSYASNVTENSSTDLTVGEAVQVEIWRGSVVAITLPSGERVITASDPEWQASNYAVPVVGVIMFPLLSFFGVRQLGAVRRGARARRQAAAQPPALPGEVLQFADLLGSQSFPLSGGDFAVRPSVQPGTVFRPRNLWIAAFGVSVLALPIAFAIANGSVPTNSRALGTFFGSVTVLPLLVLLIVALIVYRQLFLRNVRLESIAGTLHVRDWADREQSWPNSSIGGLLLVSVRAAGATRGEPRLVILGKSQTALANLNGAFFDGREIETLGARVGVPVLVETAAPIVAGLLNRRFAGSATWLELHPGLAGAAFLAVLVVAGLIAWVIMQIV
jgi:hypothetical protein